MSQSPPSPAASRTSSVTGPTYRAHHTASQQQGSLSPVRGRAALADESDSTAVESSATAASRAARLTEQVGAAKPRSSPPTIGAVAAPASGGTAVDPAVLRDRAIHAALIHAPFAWMLLFLRANEVAAVTNDWITLHNALLLYFPLVGVTAYQEYRNGSAKPLLAMLFYLGAVIGMSYPALADAPFWRLLGLVVLGYACGHLRVLWATRRLSRRMPHRLSARLSNFFKRTAGITPALVAGELVGCLLWVDDGWIIVSQSWYGYILTILFPLCLVQVSTFVSALLTSVFGGDRRHVVGRSDATRYEVIRWTVTVTTATTLLIIAVVGFVLTYVPYAWTNQLLMSPYAVVTDVLAFRAIKAAHKSRQGSPTSGRELYKTVSRKHETLIKDVMSKSKEFHCH